MQSEKEQVALSSMAASAGLTIAKAIVGISTGSLAILSEAGHSLIDFGATVMTYVAVRISGKPADEQHHYGHGKVEAISALAETALLFLLSGIVIWEALKRLMEHEGHVVEATVWAFGVIIVSVVVDFFRARALTRVAHETQSHALEADALHFSSDLWSSLAVLCGLGGVWLGYSWADSAAAFVVAVLVCVAGWRLGKRTVDTLTDVAPAGAAELITTTAAKVPGVVRVDQVRARAVGETTFVDLAVAVSRTLPIDRVDAIRDAVAAALRAGMPGAEPVVTTHPVALNNETVLDRVMVIARNRALAVHHVTVHEGGLRITRQPDAPYLGARRGGTPWQFRLPDGRPVATSGWQMMTADHLTRELIAQHGDVHQVDGFEHPDARTIRTIGAGAGYDLHNCVKALFNITIDQDQQAA